MVYHASAMEYISSLQVIVALACGWEVGISVHLCRCGVGPRDSWEEFAQTAGTSSKQSAALAFQRCCSLAPAECEDILGDVAGCVRVLAVVLVSLNAEAEEEEGGGVL